MCHGPPFIEAALYITQSKSHPIDAVHAPGGLFVCPVISCRGLPIKIQFNYVWMHEFKYYNNYHIRPYLQPNVVINKLEAN